LRREDDEPSAKSVDSTSTSSIIFSSLVIFLFPRKEVLLADFFGAGSWAHHFSLTPQRAAPADGSREVMKVNELLS